MEQISEKELFVTMPVHKAVAALAIPTIISQIVSIVYNLADTFFIGQLRKNEYDRWRDFSCRSDFNREQ